jgi:hypothetical protein
MQDGQFPPQFNDDLFSNLIRCVVCQRNGREGKKIVTYVKSAFILTLPPQHIYPFLFTVLSVGILHFALVYMPFPHLPLFKEAYLNIPSKFTI